MSIRKPTPAGCVLAASIFAVLLAAFPEQFVSAASYLAIGIVIASPIFGACFILFVVRRINRRADSQYAKRSPKSP